MTRFAAVTDFHVTVYSFATPTAGKPQIDKGREIDRIPLPRGFRRGFAEYDNLLLEHGYLPSGKWGFAWCESRHSEQPCVEVL